MTANTGSDQSTVDDGMSYDAEDKRAKNEVISLVIYIFRLLINQRILM